MQNAVQVEESRKEERSPLSLPPPTKTLFQEWGQYYEADNELKGLYATVRASLVAVHHRWRDYRNNHKGQLIKKCKVVVPSGIAAKVVQGAHAYSHPGISKNN